jgi:hypothetical protein
LIERQRLLAGRLLNVRYQSFVIERAAGRMKSAERPRLLTVSRLPDKIGPAPKNIAHERAHESIRLHPATTASALYATACG